MKARCLVNIILKAHRTQGSASLTEHPETGRMSNDTGLRCIDGQPLAVTLMLERVSKATTNTILGFGLVLGLSNTNPVAVFGTHRSDMDPVRHILDHDAARYPEAVQRESGYREEGERERFLCCVHGTSSTAADSAFGKPFPGPQHTLHIPRFRFRSAYFSC